MDVATIQVPQDEIDRKLAEYRTARHRAADAEYERVRRAYEAAASGKPLLVLSTAIANAPRDALGRPMLAIARADRRVVRYSRWQSSTHEQFSTRSERATHNGRDLVIAVPVLPGVTPAIPATPETRWGSVRGTAPVPLVPPAAKAKRDLSRCFILWEVEAWRMEPPVDPYLLQRVGEDLYIVLAEWDLTEVERAVVRTTLQRT